MADLHFRIERTAPIAFAATPQLGFTLRVDDRDEAPVPIQSVQLRVQIRIEPTRRRYGASNGPGLDDLFGPPERWGSSMRSMLWTHADVVLPPFTGSATVEFPVACTFDFNVAATKYFTALEEGDVPLCFLFSGTVFSQAEHGLQASQISWEREADFRLPVNVWREMMDRYYPNSAWLCLDRDVFNELCEYRSRHGLLSWEQAIAKLLAQDTDRVELEAKR